MREGDVIDGRFLLLSIGSVGGMGTVYRARDLATGSTVALKTLRAGDRSRFVREAETLALLDHPAIVRHVASSSEYLAMEWLDGEDLAARLRRGRLGLGETVALARRIASALAAAHAHGVIHRDLKPGNVFLPGGDVARAKLLDFGVARRPDAHRAREATAEGIVLGTLGYMAPEQARGELTIGAPADLFSLGVVMFEALTGRAPFTGSHAVAILGKLLVEPAPRLSECGARVPRELDELVSLLLAKRADDRPRNASWVLEALEQIVDAPDLDAPVPEVAPRGLGQDERKLACLVLVSPAATSDAETVSAEEWTRTRITLSDVAARHGTRLEAMIGGTMLATLESTGSIREQAARAARCALEMRDAAPGDLVVLATGRRSVGAPLGEVVERGAALLRAVRGSTDAGRVESVRTDRIRLDALSAELLAEEFTLGDDEHGPHLDGARPRPRVRHPLVGRERELGFILSTLEQCVEESSARVVVLVGGPGIGKSRLVEETLVEASPRVVWTATADPICVGSPFSVIARALERAHVAFPSDVDAAHGTRASRFREAIEARIEEECRSGPLVLVLEDLQWCDLPTLRLVDLLLRRFAQSPLFVLATARPEIAELHPRLWAERETSELRLLPLSRGASERLVRSRAGEAAPIEQILSRAQGNPLFLHELARAADEGRDATTPTTVLAVIEARLRALAPELRRVLRAASVFGAAFGNDGLLALLGPETLRDELLAPLDELVDRELVVRDGRDAYAFAHGLFAEAAHAMLTEEDRLLGHRLAAAWLGERGAASMTVAHHLEQAGEHQRAIDVYTRAAEEALDSGEHATAIVRAERGLGCGAEGERRGALEAIAADAYQHLGELETAAARGKAALGHLSPRSPHWVRASRAAIAFGVSRVGMSSK